MRKAIATDKAPAAIGPYSQGIETEQFVYTSGQLGMDPATKAFPDTIEEQTKQALENVKAILEKAGSSMDKVVKTTVFLSDMNNFAAMNEVYKSFFTGECPARSAFQVAKLPLNGMVEIEVVALKG
ncbi:RidA family protein [Dethiosulfovibrio sp. F2B]|uniref:RidA family protein n=1 Tax=Dethiosulfovibrio faecalis TaxID=2720018 RepID=UPI001F301E69|nr:RidA family protein [Dethiosulfovibrio faecalis]MCF4150980.1 RidA family protein [Dethiosulfovibrio faecalis]